MHVALFGGAFDPPHIGHQAATLQVLATHTIDQLWWLPVPVHAFAKDMATWDARIKMCAMALRHFDPHKVKLSEIEAHLPAPHYTVQTLRALHQEHPDWKFSWIIGSDNLDHLPRWHQIDQLKQLVDFIVLPRAGHDDEALLPKVSSSQLRQLLIEDAESEALKSLLDAEVLQYIQKMKIYQAI